MVKSFGRETKERYAATSMMEEKIVKEIGRVA
jgi:hypothetical protein